MSSEKWLKDYQTIERLVQTISQNLSERSKYPKSSSNYGKLSISVRTLINKLNNNINSLSRDLDAISNEGKLTTLELNRRVSLLNQLKTNEKQFEQMVRDETSVAKDKLMANNQTDLMTFEPHENEVTIGMNSDQLLAYQDRVIADQDRGLENLSAIIGNQKKIATTIGNEVGRQNVMIDSMGDRMEQINERLITQTKKIRFIDRKSTTCGIWFIIILLMVAIITIAAIPI